MKWMRIHPGDDVAVAIETLPAGSMVGGVTVLETIPAGHKIALRNISPGENIVKYAMPIGHASQAIRAGAWVHSHNLKTNLSSVLDYTWSGARAAAPECQPLEGSFMGYVRPDGRVGVRNELWIIPTVGCVNRLAENLARQANGRFGVPVYAFTHPYGCSQLGEDFENTRRILAQMARHPNAGGALVLGLGCENNNISSFQKVLGRVDAERVQFLNAQDVEDEMTEGLRRIESIAAAMAKDARTRQDISKLVIGLKCGGSDGFSGITANPLLGALTDGLCAAGGSALLTEVPEMFGAETLLMERCASRQAFNAAVDMINRYKRYFEAHGQPVYENPSPGNREGGITTLEEKSLGCVQKGGAGAVNDVLDYGESLRRPGLSLAYGPGNDLCACTALMAAGAQLILFTTGRGTPLGAPVPTLKVATNTALAMRKPGWIDFDAGVLLNGTSMQAAAQALFERVLAVASGDLARNEMNGSREIAIFKDGVIL